jgi:polar amino acid transport system substrate-binding protein
MNNKTALAALIIALVALSVQFWGTPGNGQPKTQGGVYERVMKTRTLRCAYQNWPPFLIKDPANGTLSGVYHDLFEKLGQDLSLKVEWVEEVGSGTMFEGFKTGRYDMFCSAVTPSPARALVGDFTRPIGYVPFFLYVREGDDRFDKTYAAANAAAITLVAPDGDLTAIITHEEFPGAKTLSLPNLTNGADMLMAVVSGKADAAVMDSSIAREFMRNNPGKIKQVAGKPLRFPSLTAAVSPGEGRLRQTLDIAFTHYLETGVLDRILKAYGLDESKVLRVANPYQPSAREND